MKIALHIVWYNGMGGGRAVSLSGDFLLLNSAQPFSNAFDAIELYAHVPSKTIAPDLGSLAARFEARTQKLPRVWLKRKLRQIEIAYNSKLGFAEDIVDMTRPVASIEQFTIACHEIAYNIGLLCGKLKASEDVELDALLRHFRSRMRYIPNTEDELVSTVGSLRKSEASHRTP
ncbi:MAG: hypothetical protein ACTHK7_17145 [Aureliella sp.]